MHQSIVQRRGFAVFPEFTGERVYMHGFRQSEGLPPELKRWQPTVNMMLEGIKTDDLIYLMIDQGTVKANNPHRRPGVHIDGYWVPNISAHQGSAHQSAPLGEDRREPARDHHSPTPMHSASKTGEWRNYWETSTFEEHEGIILASNVTAARGYNGAWEGGPKEGGDCAHIDLSGLRPVTMQAGSVYAGNVTMLHESLPVPANCQRTLVRLNVPGWTPQ